MKSQRQRILPAGLLCAVLASSALVARGQVQVAAQTDAELAPITFSKLLVQLEGADQIGLVKSDLHVPWTDVVTLSIEKGGAVRIARSDDWKLFINGRAYPIARLAGDAATTTKLRGELALAALRRIREPAPTLRVQVGKVGWTLAPFQLDELRRYLQAYERMLPCATRCSLARHSGSST